MTFMNPFVSPFSIALPTRVIGRLETRSGAARLASLRLRQADPPERRVHEKGIRGDAVAHASRGALEQVRGDDLVVVIGRMREGTPPVAIAQRPDSLGTGGECLVHGDVASRVHGDTRPIEPEIVGVRPPTDGQQHVRANDDRLAGGAIHANRHAVSMWLQLDAGRLGADCNPFVAEDLADGFGHVLVLAADQARAHLDHRHLRPEAAIHLREFQTDIAAADDDQVLRHRLEFEDGGVGEVIDRVHAGDPGHVRATADIDEDPRRFQQLLSDPDHVGTLKPGMPLDDGQPLHAPHQFSTPCGHSSTRYRPGP
jgi:hypothetical protein